MKIMKLSAIMVACVSVVAFVGAEECRTYTVQEAKGYNSWPMIRAVGGKLVCAYSRGREHSVFEHVRGIYARTSADGGRTWSAEARILNEPGEGDAALGSGTAADGAMLLWAGRFVGGFGDRRNRFELYRTTDGVRFEKIAEPALSSSPVQIMDIFDVPGTGLMTFWFAGDYRGDKGKSWGTLVSADNGRTWKQNTVESDLAKTDWPTEPSATYIGGGRILGLARVELGTPARLMQLTSVDSGRTWKRVRTNIGDVLESTPSVVFDAETGMIAVCYYQRGQRKLKRRVARAEDVFDRSENWPDSVVLASGEEKRAYDAGNVKVTILGKRHYAAWYTGSSTDTAVLVTSVEAAPGPSGSRGISP